MIQIAIFGNPGIKIFQGDPAAFDHFASVNLRRLVGQNIADRLRNNPSGTDGIG